MSISDYPEHVQREVRRILDGAARRLLDEQLADELDREPPLTAAGRDRDRRDRRPDKPATLPNAQIVPVLADRD